MLSIITPLLRCAGAGSGSGEEADPLIKPAPDHPVPSNHEALRELQKLVLSPAVAAPEVPAGGGKGSRGGTGAGAAGGRRRSGRAAGAEKGEGAKGRREAAASGPRGLLVVVLDEMDGLLASYAAGRPTRFHVLLY
jgi:hypothetical protein